MLENVALSFRLAMSAPTVPVVGFATVLIVGDAFAITICSPVPPQPVAKALLLASPA